MHLSKKLLVVLSVIVLTIAAWAVANTYTQTFTIVVNAAPISYTGGAFPSATVGVPYSFPMVFSGGVPPYTCTMKSGALPAGLALSGTGGCTVAGTATTYNTGSQASILVTDSQP